MEWQKLTKSSLKSLKKISNNILLYSEEYDGEFPFDVTHFMDLSDLGLPKDKMKAHWHSIQANEWAPGDRKYEYEDWELLDIYSHYLVIEKPEK